MAYNLLVEFPSSPDWRAINQAVLPYLVAFEAFPVGSSRAGEFSALALSIPSKQANPNTWAALVLLLPALWSSFGAKVIDLYTGQEVTSASLPELRQRLLPGAT